MSLNAVPVTDTRPYFRPVSRELVALLNEITPADWDRPTVAGRWLVRDVVAHLLDTTMRRLSFHRDRHEPPKPEHPPANEREFVAFINDLNQQWVGVARRLSPRVMTDLYARASEDLAAFVESLPLDAPALFPVSWAGEDASAGWFDIGREFTEQFHHQMQIRDAVGAAPLHDPAWLAAFLLIAVRGLPHAYRETAADEGATVTIDVTGPSGGGVDAAAGWRAVVAVGGRRRSRDHDDRVERRYRLAAPVQRPAARAGHRSNRHDRRAVTRCAARSGTVGHRVTEVHV